MTASKSTRARNARAAARNGTANRAGTAARSGAAGRSAAEGTGTAAGASAAAGTGTGAKNGTAAKNGAAETGAAVRNGSAGSGTRDLSRTANGGTAVRTRPGSARADAAGRAGRGDVRARTVADETASAGPSLWLQLTTFVLALAGLGVSTYLTIAHFTEAQLAGCSETSGLVDCTKVTTSAQSYLIGIPVALLGLLFYVFAVAIMSPWAWRAQRREIHLARIAAMVAGIGFVIYLLYAELFIIGNICLYCTSVHVITFLIFVLVMFSAAMWGLRPAARRPAESLETAG